MPIAGREKFAGLAASRIEERQLHRRCRTRHTIDGGVALVTDLGIRCVHVGVDKGPCVYVANAHTGAARCAFDQALFDGERADGAQHVAAVGRAVDPALRNHHLNEQVVNVCVRVQRRADNRHLAGLRAATADSVDLQLVAGAHQVEQQFVTGLNGCR